MTEEGSWGSETVLRLPDNEDCLYQTKSHLDAKSKVALTAAAKWSISRHGHVSLDLLLNIISSNLQLPSDPPVHRRRMALEDSKNV